MGKIERYDPVTDGKDVGVVRNITNDKNGKLYSTDMIRGGVKIFREKEIRKI